MVMLSHLRRRSLVDAYDRRAPLADLVILRGWHTGASLLEGAVLPLATTYAVSEAFGVSKEINLDFRRAPMFFGLFTVLIAAGAG
jgi:uncharacterized membrane protein (GlpM family)